MQVRWNGINRRSHGSVPVVLLLLVISACAGGGTPPENNANGSVGGSISVEGAELNAKVGVRVIEPIVDIDSIEIETSGGMLNVTNVPPGTAKLLQVELLPNEDLEGGINPPTPVVLNVPITVEEGEQTNVAIQVQFEQATAGTSKAASQADRPWFVRLRYSISGPGAGVRHLRIRWKDRLVQYDSNLDDVFDDEESFDDSDRDGLGNEHRELINDQAQDRQLMLREGVITELIPADHAIRLDSGLLVRFNEITEISRNGNTVRPGALRPGDSCTIRGYQVDDALFRAVEIDASSGSDLSSRS